MRKSERARARERGASPMPGYRLESETERQRDRETERQRDREKQRETERHRDRERERSVTNARVEALVLVVSFVVQLWGAAQMHKRFASVVAPRERAAVRWRRLFPHLYRALNRALVEP